MTYSKFLVGTLLLHRKKLVLFVILALAISSTTMATTTFAINDVKNKLFLKSLNIFTPDMRIRTWSSRINWTIYHEIEQIISKSPWKDKLQFSPRIATSVGVCALNKSEEFMPWPILGILVNSDFGSSFLVKNLVKAETKFSINKLNATSVIASFAFSQKYNVTLGDKLEINNHIYTIVAIYNSSTKFPVKYESSSDYPPLIFSLSTAQKILNFSMDEFNVIDFQFNIYYFSDVSEYKSTILNVLTTIRNRLDTEKIAMVIKIGDVSIYEYHGGVHPALVLEGSSPKYEYIRKMESSLFRLSQAIASAVTYLSVAISFVVVATVLLILVTKIKRDLAVLRTLGFTRLSIVVQLTTFSFIVAILSTTIGLLGSFVFYPTFAKILYILVNINVSEFESLQPVFKLSDIILLYLYTLLSCLSATIPSLFIIAKSTIVDSLRTFKPFKVKTILLSKYFVVFSCIISMVTIILSVILFLVSANSFFGQFGTIVILLWYIWPPLVGLVLITKASKNVVNVTNRFIRLSKISGSYLNAGLVRNILTFLLIVLVLTFTIIPTSIIGLSSITTEKEVNMVLSGKQPLYLESDSSHSNLSLTNVFSGIKNVEYVVGMKFFLSDTIEIFSESSNDILYTTTVGYIGELKVSSRYELNYSLLSDTLFFSERYTSLATMLESMRENHNQIIISKSIAEKIQKHVNDTLSIKIVSNTEHPPINMIQLQIVGIIDQTKIDILSGNDLIFFGPTSLENLSIPILRTIFAVKISAGHYHDTIETLRLYSRMTNTIILNDPDIFTEHLQENQAFLLFLKSIFMIPYATILLSLTLVYYISLDSKKKEISIVKALGASQMDVFLYVSLEYALLLFFAMTFGTIGNIGAISLIYISILKVEGRIITINTLISDVFKVMSFEYVSFVGLFIAIVLMSQIFITTREIYKKETISALREL